jgi:hypothetical protein
LLSYIPIIESVVLAAIYIWQWTRSARRETREHQLAADAYARAREVSAEAGQLLSGAWVRYEAAEELLEATGMLAQAVADAGAGAALFCDEVMERQIQLASAQMMWHVTFTGADTPARNQLAT